MNSFGFVAFLAAFAAANAGLLAPASILQGPSSRTTLVGPEGSIISSVSPGGQIIADALPGIITGTAPLLASSPILASPALVARSGPILAHNAAPLIAGGLIGQRSLIARGLIGERSLLAGGLIGESSLIAGPSGTISTGRTLASPLLGGLSAPGIIASPGVISARNILI